MDITFRDFQPINKWTPDAKGPRWYKSESNKAEPMFLIDQSSKRKYLNESKGIVGFKCFLLTLGTPFIHAAASVINVSYRIVKLVSLSHFWAPREVKLPFKAKLADAGYDLLRIAATPLSYIGLELAAIYGLFSPYDGRKLYASIERATYGNFILAPCFQPNPTSHAFGGDINKKNAF